MTEGSTTPDDFIGEVISIFRLDSFHLSINHDWDTDRRVVVNANGMIPGPPAQRKAFSGCGPTMGHALEDCREKIRQEFGR